jgi:hypothetical protein
MDDTRQIGRRRVCSDRSSKHSHDFAAAVKEAKRRMGCSALPRGISGETKAQSRSAVEADFDYLHGWCTDQWTYVGVSVTLRDADGERVANDSLWGIESCGDYWKETAAEIANGLIEAHSKEVLERAEWEARDTITA